MEKRIFIIPTLLCSILISALLASCNQSSGKNSESKLVSFKETTSEQQILKGEKWLRSIFDCQDDKGYCFPNEERVLTEQYYQFFIESLSIYEYPDFETVEEQITAEKAYKQKWKDIYPLSKEIWNPFGRGNGVETGFKLKNVVVTHLTDLIYTVMIHFGEDDLFLSTLQLVQSSDDFLIDYIETIYLESAEDEQQIVFLQNLALAKFTLGANPLDAHRLMGKPLFEETEAGPIEVSGFIDEDYIVTTTTISYDGIRLIYQDDYLTHAYITQSGKSFGWITVADKECNKDFIISKFKLTAENIYKNENGEETILMGDFVSLNITLDENDLVKIIKMNAGP